MKNIQIRSYFWCVFSCIPTEYRDLQSKPPYSARIRENTDQKQLLVWTLFTQLVFESSQVKSTLFPNIRTYIHKTIQFSITGINIEIKTTATAAIKNELKYFLMSEGNTCIAEPNLEVLPLI